MSEAAIWIFVIVCAAVCGKAFDVIRENQNKMIERINLQSKWIDIRLRQLERATNANCGQSVWEKANKYKQRSAGLLDNAPEFQYYDENDAKEAEELPNAPQDKDKNAQ